VRRAFLPLLAALLLALGLAAAGCGGGGGNANPEPPGTTGTTGTTETTDTEDGFTDTTETIVGTTDAYKTGQAICGNNPIEILAQQYGVKPTAAAVAKAVSLQFTSARDRKDAEAGCLAALKGQK
jgi:ABC-type glycerol-3-phosphate transport system substrate-binding protein